MFSTSCMTSIMIPIGFLCLKLLPHICSAVFLRDACSHFFSREGFGRPQPHEQSRQMLFVCVFVACPPLLSLKTLHRPCPPRSPRAYNYSSLLATTVPQRHATRQEKGRPSAPLLTLYFYFLPSSTRTRDGGTRSPSTLVPCCEQLSPCTEPGKGYWNSPHSLVRIPEKNCSHRVTVAVVRLES